MKTYKLASRFVRTASFWAVTALSGAYSAAGDSQLHPITEYDPFPQSSVTAHICPLRIWAQTFSVTTSGLAVEIELALVKSAVYTSAQLGNVTVEIQSTAVDGTPSGNTLTAVTFPGAFLPFGSVGNGSFADIELIEPIGITSGELYAIVITTDSTVVDQSDGPYFWIGDQDNLYAEGSSFIQDNTPDSELPGEFRAQNSFDFGFRILVPEPAAGQILILGMLGLLCGRRRKRASSRFFIDRSA
jgi:hypothetical protein